MPHRYFEDPYVYGPISQEEFNSITINHRMTYINGEIYVGVSQEIELFSNKLVQKPEIIEEVPTE